MTWNELREILNQKKGVNQSWNEFEESMGGASLRIFMGGSKDSLSSNALETLIEKGIITKEQASSLQELAKIEYVPTNSLKPHPLNAELYADAADSELVESVKAKGVLSPIIITEDGTIISGHRRWNAAQMAGLKEVPVIRLNSKDPLEVEELLILANRQRNKTNEQIAKEYAKLKLIEAEKARKRMLSGKSDPSVNSRQGTEKGKSSEKAAEALGIGEQKAERASKVVEYVDTLKKQGKTQEAEELRETLNNKSVNAAYQKVAKKKKEEPKYMQESFIGDPEQVYPEEPKQPEQNELEKLRAENARLKEENARLKEENARLRKENKRHQTEEAKTEEAKTESSIYSETSTLIVPKVNTEVRRYNVIHDGQSLRSWMVNPSPVDGKCEFLHKETGKRLMLECALLDKDEKEEVVYLDQDTALTLLQEEM